MEKVIVYGKNELKDLIKKTIKERGEYCDLNFIEVSHIEDMNFLFAFSNFNGDISMWDVSNVTNMECMFFHSHFNGDISEWNVGNVKDMESMFGYSDFNGDISKWNVGNVENMFFMFYDSSFNGDISRWNVGNVRNMKGMFEKSPIALCEPNWYKNNKFIEWVKDKLNAKGFDEAQEGEYVKVFDYDYVSFIEESFGFNVEIRIGTTNVKCECRSESDFELIEKIADLISLSTIGEYIM